MKTAYKVGMIGVFVWVLCIIYGFATYDEIIDESKIALVLFISFLGIVVFPIYFISVYFVYHLYNKRKN
ncbi:hypothetical protein [Ammoniphilus sp. 3BR4]|uniref:hypothetical protein n=1 Tax=Ammoniphilus sp. 3BR4 TaxID=3158265 RepID=UPI003466BF3B